jgi:predicted ATP-grasp superfamily ATP-dependent carboligase
MVECHRKGRYLMIPVILLESEHRAAEGVLKQFADHKVPVIALSSNPGAFIFKSKNISKALLSPDISGMDVFLNFLNKETPRGVIIHTTDAAAEFVAKYASQLTRAGFLTKSSSYDNFLRAFNKDRLFVEALNAGVPTIQTKNVATIADVEKFFEHIAGPIIVKATRLAGGIYRIIRTRDDISSAFSEIVRLTTTADNAYKVSAVIAQEYIESDYDDIYCCEAYISPETPAQHYLSIQKFRPNINNDGSAGSRMYAGRTLQNSDLEKYTARILNHLNWQGYAHLDWIYSPKYKQYLLCEINPRLPGFSNLLAKIDFNLAWMYYNDLIGNNYTKPVFKKALYYEALRMPGDISTSVYGILKGYFKPVKVFKSYLMLFGFRYKLVIDVFYRYDLPLTFANWGYVIKYLLKRPFRKRNG